jgi:hypothetical protein
MQYLVSGAVVASCWQRRVRDVRTWRLNGPRRPVRELCRQARRSRPRQEVAARRRRLGLASQVLWTYAATLRAGESGAVRSFIRRFCTRLTEDMFGADSIYGKQL